MSGTPGKETDRKCLSKSGDLLHRVDLPILETRKNVTKISSKISEMRKIWEGNINILENKTIGSGSSIGTICDGPMKRENQPKKCANQQH